MNRATRLRGFLVRLLALATSAGCTVEFDDDLDLHLPITGRVTYHGQPVRRGAIHFLGADPAHPPASGAIVDGAIKDVYTRKPGDGVRSGRYKVAITAFDDDLVQSAAKRDGSGPDPVEVARAANQIRILIPVRYNNPRDSGLTAELSVANHALQLELVD